MSQFLDPANWNVTSTSTIFRINSHDKFSIITTHDATSVRNTITALFVLVNFCAAAAGAAYIKTRARHRIAKGREVSVKHLTSWLALPETAKYAWSLRDIPGGWLGILMIFTGLVSILHQFATNSLVTPTTVPTRCVFDYGATLNKTIYSPAPGPDDAGSDLVFEAQLAAQKNHGVQGIYHKLFAPNEIQMFRPEAEDTHGTWTCKNVRNQSLPWHGPAIPVDQEVFNPTGIPGNIWETYYRAYINSTIFSRNQSGFAASEETIFAKQVNSQELVSAFMIWGVSNLTLGPVKASILNSVPLVNGKANAMDFECGLNLKGDLPYLSYELTMNQVLSLWAPRAFGYQKQLSTVKESALWLEIVLNQIFMLAIFDDFVVPKNINSIESIGCVVDGTRVSIGIIMILGAVTLLFFGFVVAQCYYLLKYRRLHSKKGKPGALLAFDLADWQLAAYRQGNAGGVSTFKELRKTVCQEDENGTGVSIRFSDSAQKLQGVESRASTLHDKFDWEDRDGFEYHTEHTNQKPWIQVLERPAVKSERQSSITSPYTSISDTHEFQRTDEQGLLEQCGDPSTHESDNVVR